MSRKFRKLSTKLGVAACLAFAPAAVLPDAWAQAQSFNCRYAKTPDEVLICQDPRLSALDQRMSSIFFRRRNRLSGRARADLDAEQAAWLRGRMACGRDAGCIATAYQARIRELTGQ
jgi:uncharacterized protein